MIGWTIQTSHRGDREVVLCESVGWIAFKLHLAVDVYLLYAVFITIEIIPFPTVQGNFTRLGTPHSLPSKLKFVRPIEILRIRP
jgi:hypothetical protein